MAIDEQVVWATLGKLVRHDLRSSLSPIIGGIDLLQTGELNATQAKFVAMIQQGGDRIGIYQRRAQALLAWLGGDSVNDDLVHPSQMVQQWRRALHDEFLHAMHVENLDGQANLIWQADSILFDWMIELLVRELAALSQRHETELNLVFAEEQLLLRCGIVGNDGGRQGLELHPFEVARTEERPQGDFVLALIQRLGGSSGQLRDATGQRVGFTVTFEKAGT